MLESEADKQELATQDSVEAEVKADAVTGDTEKDANEKSGKGKLVLAVLFAAIIMLAAYFGNRYWSERSSSMSEGSEVLVPSFEESQKEQRVADLEAQIKKLSAEVSQLNASQQQNEAKQLNAEETILQLFERSNRNEQALFSLNGANQEAQTRWLRAEIQYFLEVANQRLLLAGDYFGAEQALSLADQKLVELADPGMTALRRQIDKEMTELRLARQVDRVGLAASLNNLLDQVDRLPLQTNSEENFDYEPQAALPEEASVKEKLLEVFGSFVRVEKIDADFKLSEQERFLLRRNVELEISLARFALLQQDQGQYDKSLAQARLYIESYFAADDEAVEMAMMMIDELASASIVSDMPDISQSLRMFKRING